MDEKSNTAMLKMLAAYVRDPAVRALVAGYVAGASEQVNWQEMEEEADG